MSLSGDNYIQGARRPLIGLMICFMAGCFLGLKLCVPVPFILAACYLLLIGALLFIKKKSSTVILHILILSVAWLHTSLSASSPSSRELNNLMKYSREYVEICGVIVDDPSPEPSWKPGYVNWVFPLKLEGIHRRQNWQEARGKLRVRISMAETKRPFRYGDRWILAGLLKERSYDAAWLTPYELEGEKNWGKYLSEGNGNILKARCLDGRARCSKIISRGLQNYPDTRGLLRALLLGYRKALPPALKNTFAATGTLHIFAISGLHVGVMAVLIIAVLKMLGISRQYWILYLGPALILYVMATGLKASAIRACIMALLYWSGPLFRRKPDGRSALAAAALFILIFMPKQLVAPGFILSFTVVTGIILMYPVFLRIYTAPFNKPSWVPGRPNRKARWRKVFVGHLCELAAVSTAAWLVSAPLTAYYFNLFSPIGLAGNILIVPGSFLVVLTGCLSLVFGSVFPILAEIFNHANRIFVAMLLWVVGTMRDIPYGHSFIRAPSQSLIILWYTLLTILIFMKTGIRKWLCCVIAVILMTGLALIGYRQVVTIDILNVGEGNAAFINLPGSDDIMVDTGPSYYASRVMRHLQKEGVDHLQTVILTHPDADHTGALDRIMDRFAISEIWCSPYKGRSRRYDATLTKAREKGIRIKQLEAGATGVIAGELAWEVFSPVSKKKFRSANGASLVMRFGRKATSILFMGGAGQVEEAGILERGIDPAANIMIAGNHGAEKTAGNKWLSAVAPELAVISAGKYSKRGNPAPAVIERLQTHGIEIWRTDLQEGLSIQLSDNPLSTPYTLLPTK